MTAGCAILFSVTFAQKGPMYQGLPPVPRSPSCSKVSLLTSLIWNYKKEMFPSLLDTRNANIVQNSKLCERGRSFSTYAKYSEQLIFLTSLFLIRGGETVVLPNVLPAH